MSVCFFPKMCMAIGTVLARPDKNSDQPNTLRRSPLNLSASNSPAPNPIAPRVAATSASSGTLTFFDSEMFMVVLLNQVLTNSPAVDTVHLQGGWAHFPVFSTTFM